MAIRQVCAVGSALLTTICIAQETPLYDGTWIATFGSQGEAVNSAEIVLKGATGTWTSINNKTDRTLLKRPCDHRELPATVLKSSPAELIILVDGEQVLQGCGRKKIIVKPVDDKRLEGRFAKGQKIMLIRR